LAPLKILQISASRQVDFKKLFLRMSPARSICVGVVFFCHFLLVVIFFFSSTKIISHLYTVWKENQFAKKGFQINLDLLGKKGESYWSMGTILCLGVGRKMVGLLPLGVAVASCAPDVRSESKTKRNG
jgi:hypothetical protein